MVKIDLITGFLGAGKTTFIKKYAKHFLDKGQNIGILENDYGAVNVDMMLLNDLISDNCELEMVAGACDADCHKRRFKTKLISMGMCGYDRVIVEPSGIFDVDEFFDSLREEPLDKWYEIGNVIAIVDARLEENLSDIADYYLASQVANAGMIVVSKTNLANKDELENCLSHIEKANEKVKTKRKNPPEFMTKSWESLEEADFEKIANCGYEISSFVKFLDSDNNGFDTVYFLEPVLSKAIIDNRFSEIFSSEKYGNVFRIKGFFEEAGTWYQINATKKEIDISPIKTGQQVLIIIGEGLNEDLLRRCFDGE